jgi:hypothetical protein
MRWTSDRETREKKANVTVIEYFIRLLFVG